MNTDLLIAWLDSEKNNDRLRAARHLSKIQDPSCLEQLRISFQREQVPWIKNALLKALQKYQKEGVQSYELYPAEIGDVEIAEIESNAINDSIGQVLHELDPAVGRIKVVAGETLGESFEGSALQGELNNLESLMVTFENWRKVEQEPVMRRVDVRYVVDSVILQIKSHFDSRIEMQLVSSEKISIQSDEQLLRIVLSNALRNAVDATLAIDEPKPIVVNYDITDKNFWMSVNDKGIGLPPNLTNLVRAKVSTKPGHKGMGLAIVDKAIVALQGEWDLRNGAAGGAEFYFEIPRGGE